MNSKNLGALVRHLCAGLKFNAVVATFDAHQLGISIGLDFVFHHLERADSNYAASPHLIDVAALGLVGEYELGSRRERRGQTDGERCDAGILASYCTNLHILDSAERHVRRNHQSRCFNIGNASLGHGTKCLGCYESTALQGGQETAEILLGIADELGNVAVPLELAEPIVRAILEDHRDAHLLAIELPENWPIHHVQSYQFRMVNIVSADVTTVDLVVPRPDFGLVAVAIETVGNLALAIALTVEKISQNQTQMGVSIQHLGWFHLVGVLDHRKAIDLGELPLVQELNQIDKVWSGNILGETELVTVGQAQKDAGRAGISIDLESLRRWILLEVLPEIGKTHHDNAVNADATISADDAEISRCGIIHQASDIGLDVEIGVGNSLH